jgi:hypothetical protein
MPLLLGKVTRTVVKTMIWKEGEKMKNRLPNRNKLLNKRSWKKKKRNNAAIDVERSAKSLRNKRSNHFS